MLMKKLLITSVALLILLVACKEGGSKQVEPVDNYPTDTLTKNQIPAELIGKWSYGTFSPTNFWNYNGTYAGNAYEQALVFEFRGDGTYEEYIINSATSYNCRTEAYTYFKGKVTVDQSTHSLVITPASGTYRGFYACAPKSNINRAAKPSELVQEQMNYQVENGKSAIRLSDAANPQGVRLKAVTW